MSQRENSFFDESTSKVVWFLLSGTRSLPLLYGFCWNHGHSHSRRTQSQWKLYHSWNISKNAKSWFSPCKWRVWSCSFSADLGHVFGGNVGGEFRVMLRRKGPHNPEVAYDVVRIKSLMIYTDLIEYNTAGDTKAPLMHCFLFISKLKLGDNMFTGQYMNCQTFSNLHFRPLLKNFFHSVHIDLRDTSGKKYPLCLGITRLVLLLRKSPNIHFERKRCYKMVALRQVQIPFYRGIGQQRERISGALVQVFGLTAIPILGKYVVPAANRVGAE